MTLQIHRMPHENGCWARLQLVLLANCCMASELARLRHGDQRLISKAMDVIRLFHVCVWDPMFLWGVIYTAHSVTGTGWVGSEVSHCNFAADEVTKSTHMERLECMIGSASICPQFLIQPLAFAWDMSIKRCGFHCGRFDLRNLACFSCKLSWIRTRQVPDERQTPVVYLCAWLLLMTEIYQRKWSR